MKSERLACILIPDFPLVLACRRDPALVGRPVAITENDSPTAPIVICNNRAVEHDVRPGLTATQAHVICPELTVLSRDRTDENKAAAKIQHTLQTIGPLVEADRPGVYFMETSGLIRLHKSEKRLARKIIVALAALGYPVRVGMAANKFVARVAARSAGDDSYCIVADGNEAAFVRKLDVALLNPSKDTQEHLNDLGLKTIGQLAVFPTNEVTERFGTEGAALADYCRGKDNSRLVRNWPKEGLFNEVFLTYRILRSDTILKHFERLIAPLLHRLAELGLGCTRIILTLTHEDKSRTTLTPSVQNPTLAAARFGRQLIHQLQDNPVRDAVMGLRIDIEQGAVALLPSRQVSLGQDTGKGRHDKRNDPELNRFLKDHQIRRINLNSAFLPEQSFELPMAPGKQKYSLTPDESVFSTPLYPTHGLRLLPRPVAVQIEFEDGCPNSFKIRRGKYRVNHHDGPWRLSGEWWQNDFDRQYYQLQTDDQRRFLFFFDSLNDRWFLQGVFD